MLASCRQSLFCLKGLSPRPFSRMTIRIETQASPLLPGGWVPGISQHSLLPTGDAQHAFPLHPAAPTPCFRQPASALPLSCSRAHVSPKGGMGFVLGLAYLHTKTGASLASTPRVVLSALTHRLQTAQESSGAGRGREALPDIQRLNVDGQMLSLR